MKIFIDNLILNIRIGVFEEEKMNPQKFVVNLECCINKDALNNQKPGYDYLCYKTLAEQIQRHFESKHTELVETAAEEIAQMCLGHPLCFRVWVKVGKPDALENASMVGCSLIRSKENTFTHN